MRILFFLAAVAFVAGCVATPEAPPATTDAGAQDVPLAGGALLHVDASEAGISKLQLAQGSEVSITFPAGTLVKDDKGGLHTAKDAVKLGPGKTLSFLPPWNVSTGYALKVASGGETQDVNVTFAPGSRLVSGDLALTLLKVQREKFPHRTPGQPNYAKAEQYFADFFKALNYTVETNAYGSTATVPLADRPGPQSAESVLGTKKGTTKADRYLIFGGHFDVVEGTTEGAFDNTAGAVATLAMAQAFQNITTQHSIIFAEWGGEEDGIVGSANWLNTHPQMIPFIDGYVNFDVVALAYPAPKVDPAPIVVTAGPDGPIADKLHQYAADIEKTYVKSGAKLVMENWARDQATAPLGLGGAGVNAQSDHTPFAAHGIPVYFEFTSKVPDVFTIIHNPKDTVENMTRYSYGGVQAIGQNLTAEEMAEGEWYLARSFEAQMVPMFVYVVLTDDGTLPVPSAPPAVAI